MMLWFAPQDRSQEEAFFDLLPQEIRIRCKKEVKHAVGESSSSFSEEEVILSTK